jgi:hypothetical protein
VTYHQNKRRVKNSLARIVGLKMSDNNEGFEDWWADKCTEPKDKTWARLFSSMAWNHLTEKHAREIEEQIDCSNIVAESLTQRVESAESKVEKLTKCECKGEKWLCQGCRNRKTIEGSNE